MRRLGWSVDRRSYGRESCFSFHGSFHRPVWSLRFPGRLPEQCRSKRFRFLYALNPMVGVFDDFRWSLLGTKGGMYWPGLVIAVIEVIVLLASDIWYFRKTEQTFADVI